ncbi:unnamed protein product [Euphydryas editha]|uniref:Uncharacterized protein n=1 Tax=Euphydryas editha TaxID=104508 RepID=A0AAU9URS2_EUPED|nr:unnamed protein product [Euphydryas editha]
MNNIEISGVTQKHGENLLSILNCISIIIGFQLHETDVDTIHRVRRFITSVDSRKYADPRHPAIIVRFCQRRRKDALIVAARERRHITTADAGLPGLCTPPGRRDPDELCDDLLITCRAQNSRITGFALYLINMSMELLTDTTLNNVPLGPLSTYYPNV